MAERKARASYHHGDLERALIAEALVLTEERGLESWNFAEMARRIGVSSAAPYRHFRSKTELLDAVARDGLQLVRDVIARAVSHDADPRSQLVAVSRGIVRFAHRNPTLYRLTFAGVRTDTLKKLASADASTAFGTLRRAVVGWMECGLLVQKDPIEMAILLWAHVHGLASLVAARRIELSERAALKMAEDHAGLLLSGIAK